MAILQQKLVYVDFAKIHKIITLLKANSFLTKNSKKHIYPRRKHFYNDKLQFKLTVDKSENNNF